MSSSSYGKFNVPIQRSSRDTTTQWVMDPASGREKYRMKINIEGFNQNEVRIRVDGDRLFIYGERIENKSQGTSKKIIENHYNLPSDIDTSRPYVTFPSPMIMQVDFPSKYVPTRSSRYSLPLEFDTHKYKDASRHSSRRIPIIHSRDSSTVPSNSTYQFRPTRNSDQTIVKTHRIRDRSGSPALSSITEEGSVRSVTPHTDTSNESPVFPSDFNSEAFYRSEFQPEIFTNGRDQRYIELKLDVHEYNPDDIKVSINDNDLIVQIEKTNFYKQITLPENIDVSSLSVHHHHDKKLYITIKLLDEYSSIKYI